MKNILAAFATFASASQFLCLFCCIVPTATGILAILASFGLAGGNTLLLGDIALAFHPWRGTIMVVAITLISLSWFSWFYAKRPVMEKSDCGCHAKKTKKPIFLMIATGILAINLIAFEFMH